MFSKKVKKVVKRIKNKKIIIPLILLLIVIILISFLEIYTADKISPGIKIADLDLSYKNKTEAYDILHQNIVTKENFYLVSKNNKYEINLQDIDFSYNFAKSIEKAYYLTRSGNIIYDLGKKISLFLKKENLGLEININEKILEEKIQKLGENLEIKPVSPNVFLTKSSVKVEKGVKGLIIDKLLLRANIGKSLAYLENKEIEIPLVENGYILNEVEAQEANDRAVKLIGKNIKLNHYENVFILTDQILVGFIDPKNEYSEEKINTKINEISFQIDRDPQDSVFVFEQSKVTEFTPSKDGYEVEKNKLKNMIMGNLRTLEQTDEKEINLDIPVKISKPKIQNKDVNNLGIETLLGRGTSKFVGSISNRIYNIGHASAKFIGIIIPPGEKFSFNDTLGDVSQETGFKQAYIIKEGKTILGDGGGVCQVSTTLFRAVLNAGLPILERQAHAYRVGYYEQDSPPGLDATVYAPHPDLIIENNTPNHILIQSSFNEKNRTLAFEIYGTDDGRISNVSKPIITSQTPPSEDLYQDDPTLKQGTIKQVEYKAWGAKVKFDYEVKRDNKTIYKKTFYSNYQPWQAVYLRGTMPQ